MKGNFEGLKGYVVGRMTKSRRGKIYIDDEGWGPYAGSIEYGYRVPFGGIHVFVGCIHGSEYPEGSVDGGETAICSDATSSTGETDSLYQLQDGMLRGCSDGSSILDTLEPPNCAGVFMAGTQLGQNSTAAAATTTGWAAAGS